jgi:hypothetical protein
MSLNKLRYEVTIRTMSICNTTKPVDLIRTLLKRFFRRQGSAICCNLGDKERVLVDLGRAGAAHIASNRKTAKLLDVEAVCCGNLLINSAAAVLFNEVCWSSQGELSRHQTV